MLRILFIGMLAACLLVHTSPALAQSVSKWNVTFAGDQMVYVTEIDHSTHIAYVGTLFGIREVPVDSKGSKELSYAYRGLGGTGANYIDYHFDWNPNWEKPGPLFGIPWLAEIVISGAALGLGAYYGHSNWLQQCEANQLQNDALWESRATRENCRGQTVTQYRNGRWVTCELEDKFRHGIDDCGLTRITGHTCQVRAASCK